MQPTEQKLRQIVQTRIRAIGEEEFVERASEVVVFGSVAMGLQRTDSDVDILCFSDEHYKRKSHFIDLIVVPQRCSQDPGWLQSELATHVATYGRWIKGEGAWKDNARIGRSIVDCKRRRVTAFMKALPRVWDRLHEGFREMYATKVRRETQRLILLENGVPVPPTLVLDRHWNSLTSTPNSHVLDRVLKLAVQPGGTFASDIAARISAQFEMQTTFNTNSILSHN